MADWEDEAMAALWSFKERLDTRDALIPKQQAVVYDGLQHREVSFASSIAPLPEETSPHPEKRLVAPTPPTATILCDSISASKSKCGFSEYGTPSSPPKYYLVQTFTGHKSDPSCPCNPAYGSPQFCPSTSIQDIERVTTYSTALCTSSTHDNTNSYLVTYCDGHVSDFGGYRINDSHVFLVTSKTLREYDNNSSFNCADGGSPCYTTTGTINNVFHEQYELSSEYTTATLESNTVSALPSYAGFAPATHGTGQGTTCSAYRNLSSDETSYSIRRFCYEFNYDAAAPVDGELHWTTTFTPTTGSPVTTAHTASVFAGDTGTTIFNEPEPSTNGTTALNTGSIRWSNVGDTDVYGA